MAGYMHPHLLKARIVERVGQGETVAAIGQEPGMPCAGSVQVWRRADPGFAAELMQARLRADFQRLRFDEAKATAFLARLWAGERVSDLLDRPGMPSQRLYKRWRRTEPSFQEALWRLKGARLAARQDRLRRRFRAFDQAVADRILVRVAHGERMRRMLETDPTLPCRVVVYRWRKAEPEWDRAMRTAMRWGRHARGHPRAMLTEELSDAIMVEIMRGASLRSLGARPDMPAARTLYSWVASRRAFAEAVQLACDLREDGFADRVAELADAVTPANVEVMRREISAVIQRSGRLQNRPGRKWRGDDAA